MTISELIFQLAHFPHDAEVVTRKIEVQERGQGVVGRCSESEPTPRLQRNGKVVLNG